MQTINTIREKRIQRILAAPTNRILDLPWVKRLLCIVMVAGSYMVLASNLIPYSNKDLLMVKILTGASGIPWWMIAAFFVLRSSTRRITSLPDQYLDEREIELRDWAFKMGYLVVRRIGLAISGLILMGYAMFYAFYLFTAFSTFYSAPSEEKTWWGTLLENFNDYLKDVVGPMPILTYASIIFLLTYVAYSFPLILVAWRDARDQLATTSNEPVHTETQLLADQFKRTSKRYFKLLIAAVLSIPGAFGTVFLLFVLPIFSLLTMAAFLFAPAVYIWAEVKVISALFTLKVSGLLKSRQKELLRLAVGAAIAGAAVPGMYGMAVINADLAIAAFWIAIASGLTAVGLHIAAFTTLRLVSNELVSGETTSS